MFSRDDLSILDGTKILDAIRMRPDRFLPPGEVSAEILACRLLGDILIRERRLAVAIRLNAWWIVASDEDWLPNYPEERGRDPFTSILAFPEAGPNSMHAEVLITAFSRDVVTFADRQERTVQGESDDALREFVGQHPEWRRCVAFRLD